jgi:hypothetical protein
MSKLGAAALALAGLALVVGTREARAQTTPAATASARNVTLRLTIPDGVTKVKAVFAFTVRGLASGWAGHAGFKEMIRRLESATVMVQGGDDLNDRSYPGRCASGEFNGIGEALAKLAESTGHPELAHAPLVGIGHSHGGDYWNWYNACHPERMALVFVHASGGVNYSAAALKTPVLYELGTGDLIERGSKQPRAGMFANRSKGAPMSLVIGQGEGHDNVSAASLDMVLAIMEATFKLRVPADADPARGPVRLHAIDEATAGTWVGDLYTKEIAPYAAFTGNKGLTAFLPNEEVARKWRMTGPPLPMNVAIPTGVCSWCGDPNDEPKDTPDGPAPPPSPAPPASPADAGPPPPTTAEPDAAPPTAPPQSGVGGKPTVRDPSPAPVSVPAAPASGGCSVGGRGEAGLSAVIFLLALMGGCCRWRARF